MSGHPDPAAAPAKEDPEALVLRGRPRPAVRFRRGLIVGIAGAAAAALVTVSWLALEPPMGKAVTNVDGDQSLGKPSADALAGAPATYGDVPRLGPPLPGDLGQPILEREGSLAGPPNEPADALSAGPDAARSAAEEEQQRLASERQAARSSPVIVQLARSGSASGAAEAGEGQPQAGGSDLSSAAPAHAGAQRDDVTEGSGTDGANPDALGAPPSPWTLSAGTVIPASLITGLDSDLPGTIVAQVTENVRDSATGRTVLVPQGARLIGSYDSKVAHGQRRALLVWTRIVLPDGSSIRLDDMPATDSSGYAGLEDRVDSHGWQLLKGVVLSTLLGVGTQLSIGGDNALVRAIREAGEQNASDAGNRITSRNLDIQPTIRVRPGWPVRAILNKDLVLRPWRG